MEQHHKNWKQTWLKAASSVCDGSIDDFLGNWLAYTSCMARNERRSGAVHLERCLQVSSSLTNTVRDLTALEAAICSAWFRRDALLAEKWLKQLVRPKLMQPLDKYRVDFAMRYARTGFEADRRLAQRLSKVQSPPTTRPVDIWSEST
jgi:hypothetical protein